ncbi:SMP-30/gluconolactonase/LRE family protein [Halovulum marinum]|nr:SMP-30/gluconolactonase/LRE family protein [Halovulum marinum]
MQASLFKELTCALGEGPLWDEDRLWFFDITGHGVGGPRLYCLSEGGSVTEHWDGERMASAAARTAKGGLLVATETDLMHFDPAAGIAESLCPLEADNPITRSNDGRADPQGGFWIGTMGRNAEAGAGAIYRWHRGELRALRKGVTIPNAICFAPDGREAYFADTRLKTIWRWRLDADGWPVGAPAEFHVMQGEDSPDGAVIDETGSMWLAVWGGWRVQRISPDGIARERIELPVSNVTCPALTPDGRLYVTTARQGLQPSELDKQPLAGSVFLAEIGQRGIPEPRVML